MIQLTIIIGYLALLLLLGFGASRFGRGTSKDYLLASHSIGPVLLLLSLFGTTMTAFALVGSTGEAFRRGVGVYGMLASSSGIIHSLCFFVLGVPLWRLGQKYGYRTQVQFFRDRLDSDRIGLVLFPVLVALVIPYLLIGVMSAGLFINVVTQGRVVPGAEGSMTIQNPTFSEGTFPSFLEAGYATPAGSKGGVPRHLASLVICGVVLSYVFFGGMRGTAWANGFQTLLFMVLGVVMFYLLAQQLGGETSFFANLKKLGASIPPEKLTRSDISPWKFLTYMFVPLSVGMFPHLFQHWLTARSAESFKLAVVLHPVFIMIVWVPCILLGVWAAGELVNVPPPVAAEPNKVLAFMVKSTGWPVLAGLLTAGVLAAIMSSLDSQFLCLGTMFSEDVMLHYGGRDRFTDQQHIWTARMFIIAIVGLTYFFSLFEPRQVFTLGVWCFSGFASLFPLAVAALYWRGLTKAGAYAALLTAIGMWFWLFRASGYADDEAYAIAFNVGGTLIEVMPVAPMVLASTLGMIVVSLVTPKPNAATLAKFFPAS
ncbi:sodium:solute symporter family protein [Botrimarina hoheduenensis]|uniref:Sodium/proline symporter n=1 Tax=Botrimarina hoheduenensis TaxID=2528000 RepID=A0A5C5VXX1_9BACT|nr:sodium:solute symporter family protein [Botrimarina hoheduenensis]TWT43300.1 Sodium/proline symporter [Botrimarina hoheduenensis]